MSTVSGKTFFGGTVPPPPATAKPVTSSHIGQSAIESILDAAKGGLNQAISGYNLAAGAGNEIVRGGLGAVPSATAHVLEGGAAVGAGIINTAFSPLAPIVQPTIGAGINAAGEALSNTPLMQAYGHDTASLGTQQLGPERILNDILNVDTIAQGAAALKVPEGIQRLSNAVQERFKASGELPPPRPPLNPAEPPTTSADPQFKTIEEQWTRPTTVAGNTFKNARAVLEKDPSIPKFLVQEKIDPEMHITDGKYMTLDTAEALQETAGKLSVDGLRPSLQMADYSTPKTPLTEIATAAAKRGGSEYGVTAADAGTVASDISKEIAALQEKYHDGMSLTNMHDEGITYSKNGGYKPFASAADTNKAIANRALSSALKTAVEKKAPPSLPVHDFNSYLSTYYKAADYLTALNGRKAPLTLFQNIRGAALKFTGAGLGQTLGGGIVSSFAGYTIGKALEHALENMTNPVRTQFLNNLQHTNPEAFTRVTEYLQQQTSGNTGIPRLNAPESIQTPPPSEAVQMKGRALQLEQAKSSPPTNGSTLLDKAKEVFNTIKTQGNRGFIKFPINSGKVQISPRTVATQAGISDIFKIKDYLAKSADPSIATNAETAIEPLIKQFGIQKLSEADAIRFLQEVVNEFENAQPRIPKGAPKGGQFDKKTL